MANYGELFEKAIEEWRVNKGVGTAFVPPKFNDKLMVLGILQGVYNRSPTCNTIIIVETFSDRIDLCEFLTHQEGDDENNKEFKQLLDSKTIKILTSNYVNSGINNVRYSLCILYRCSTISEECKKIFENSKFKLAVIQRLLETSKDTSTLYKLSPILNCFSNEEIQAIRNSTPVEEVCIGLTLPKDSEEYKLLKYYDEYVTTSLNIFGSFEALHEAYAGNKTLNISSQSICNRIAKDNGWNEHLDMSIEYNRQIDALYNPNNIKDRAAQTYEVIRSRQKLVTSNELKLNCILNYVNEHKDDKILIISKHSSFAKKITNYINTLSEDIICGDYHDCVESIPAVDLEGNPIFIKSGVHKGERKMMAAKAQKTLNKAKFDIGKLRVLSTNAAPDKELDVKIDRILISSPTCSDVKAYIYRLDKLKLPQTLNVGLIYIKGTFEERNILDKEPNSTINKEVIVKNDDVDINFSDFVIAD